MRPVNTSANLERNDALSQHVNKLSVAIGTQLKHTTVYSVTDNFVIAKNMQAELVIKM